MHLNWSDADLKFRDEVRAFLDAELTPELRRVGSSLTSVYAEYEPAMAWQKILNRKGWAAPAWPKEYGGTDWSITQRYIFSSELSAAGAPPLSPMGLGMCAPVLMGHGTPEQKAYYLPRILNGDDFWCQGYSEPGSGSDLASLQMAAVDDGNDLICTGHKLWTTHAHRANLIFCLVRTSKEAIPQKGITFLLIDMTSPGVEVQPIISLSGEHIQNHVFFTDVRVPKKNVVGRIGDGWGVAKYLMQFERGGGASTPGLKIRADKIAAMIRKETEGRPELAAEAAALRSHLADAMVQIAALEATELKLMARLSAGDPPGAESSLQKTVGSELSQRLTEIALTAAGLFATVYQPHTVSPGGPVPGYVPPNDGGAVGPDYAHTVAAKYFNDRAGSIYAGSNEIQRNIIAKGILGL